MMHGGLRWLQPGCEVTEQMDAEAAVPIAAADQALLVSHPPAKEPGLRRVADAALL